MNIWFVYLTDCITTLSYRLAVKALAAIRHDVSPCHGGGEFEGSNFEKMLER